MKRVEKPAVLVIVLIIGLLMVTGCNALRKPAPENTPEAQVPAPSAPSREPMPGSPEEVERIASELTSVADRVSGEQGHRGYSRYDGIRGIDQKAGLEDEETERIKRDVSNEVKAAEPRLTAVYVSSDPDTVSRLRQIANGIANGQPVSAFDQELAEIVKRISQQPGKIDAPANRISDMGFLLIPGRGRVSAGGNGNQFVTFPSQFSMTDGSVSGV